MEIEAVDYLKSRGFKFNDHTNKLNAAQPKTVWNRQEHSIEDHD
jgi:hypothetical protein